MVPKRKLTAAVYDRWLSTLGGGEQVAFAYAEVLRDLGYETTLLTHKKLNKVSAVAKMNVNLDGIKIRYLPETSSQETSQYTEEFDLFINSSHLDYFACRSDQGVLSVFFPDQIYLTPYEFIKRALVIPSLRNFFIYPSRFEGFLYDEFKEGELYKWLGKESRVIFKENVPRVRLSFYFHDLSFSVLDQIVFTFNNQKISPVKKTLFHRENQVDFDFVLPSAEQKVLQIKLPSDQCLKAVALVRLTIPSWRFVAYNLFKKFFPKWEMRLHGGPGVSKRSDLESYQKIITISRFCQKWIRKYWGLPSQVLYPPVNVKNFKPQPEKKNRIIHIGRFFITGHNKKQLDLVKVFKRLVDEHQVEDWELHFVGSVHEGERHQDYFEKVQAEADTYPIFFHTNVPFDQLRQLLAESKIYWHATGLDENERKNPINFEHFGVTTVEAMASGCVPVVINAGGQKEIVTQESGFRWKNRRELINNTLELIKDPKLLKKMSIQAQKRSQYFSREKFRDRFEKILQSDS